MADTPAVPVLDDTTSNKVVQTEFSVSPADFERFIAWACKDFTLTFTPFFKKSYIECTAPNTPNSKYGKGTKMNKEVVPGVDHAAASIWNFSSVVDKNPVPSVNIHAVYDSTDRLVQLKILRNKEIPCPLIKLMSLTVPFHIYLTAIYIDKGLNKNGMYQLAKLVANSNITDVILDNTVILEANYYLLLDDNSQLKYLSLARCSLNDIAIKEISSRLLFPSSASESLSALNLCGNRITDVGAKYLGDMLRTNRKLTYLNLAGNLISATGADSIFNSLITFELIKEELYSKRERYFKYFKEKLIIDNMEKKTKSVVEKNKVTLKVPSAPAGRKSQGISDDLSRQTVSRVTLSSEDDRSKAIAKLQLPPLKGPFKPDEITVTDGVVYCYGNNIVSYINLAYNNLNYHSVKKLYEVLLEQKNKDRTPRGLIGVCIDGNDIPITCMELRGINTIIESILSSKPGKRATVVLRKK